MNEALIQNQKKPTYSPDLKVSNGVNVQCVVGIVRVRGRGPIVVRNGVCSSTSSPHYF